MFHLSEDVILPIAILTIVFTAGTIIPLGITWMQQRTKTKAIEVLKTYAERGQDPPASVLDAVNRINWPFPPNTAPPPKPMSQQSRAEHLSHFAGSVGLAGGAGVVLWWLGTNPNPKFEWLFITAIFVAIFFTASGLARLVAALASPVDGGR
jgi:hypothetical protein